MISCFRWLLVVLHIISLSTRIWLSEDENIQLQDVKIMNYRTWDKALRYDADGFLLALIASIFRFFLIGYKFL